MSILASAQKALDRVSRSVCDVAGWLLAAMAVLINVETLVSRFGPGGQHAAAILAAMAGLIVAAVCAYATGALFYASWHFATASIQPSATPLWLPQIILPVAFSWLCVIYVHQALRAFEQLRKPRP